MQQQFNSPQQKASMPNGGNEYICEFDISTVPDIDENQLREIQTIKLQK